MRLELGRYDTQGLAWYFLRGTHVITCFRVLARFDTWSEFDRSLPTSLCDFTLLFPGTYLLCAIPPLWYAA